MSKTLEAALKEHVGIQAELATLQQELKSSQEREAIQRGRIAALEQELADIKERSDFNLRCAVEITMQLHNVGIFVSDALHTAKAAVGQGNGQTLQSAYEKVEQALGVTHESIQSESNQRQIPDNQVHK